MEQFVEQGCHAKSEKNGSCFKSFLFSMFWELQASRSQAEFANNGPRYN
jgi:hypothetical protein